MFSPEMAGVSAISITILWDTVTEKKNEWDVFSTRENLKSVCLNRKIHNECFDDSKKYEVE